MDTGGTRVGADTEVEAGAGDTPPGRRRWRGRRVVLVLGAMLLAVVGLVGGSFLVLSENLGNNIVRVPGAFAGLDEALRPPASEALTFLLVGTDTRSDVPTTGEAAGGAVVGDRSDVLMLARVDPSRRTASVVSIPRDSWVDIPGRGPDKVNAAYALGGPGLLVGTVEALSGLRVDHFGVIDFAGFEAVVDAVGGVDVAVAEATGNDGVQFQQGVNHLDGAAALAFVRQRYDLAGGDLDRAQRQQAVLRALLGRAASGGVFGDPGASYRLLDALTRSVGVDDTLSNGGLRALVLDLRALRPSAVTFVRAPVAGFGREGEQSVVRLDPVASADLWRAVRDGGTAAYAAAHPADALCPITR